MTTKQIPLLTSCCSLYSLVIGLHRVPVKQSIAAIFGHNVCKCQPMFNILSLTDSRKPSMYTRGRKFHFSFSTLLHYLVKCDSYILSTSLSRRTCRAPARRAWEPVDAVSLFRTLCGRPTVDCAVENSARPHLKESDQGRGRAAAAREEQ